MRLLIALLIQPLLVFSLPVTSETNKIVNSHPISTPIDPCLQPQCNTNSSERLIQCIKCAIPIALAHEVIQASVRKLKVDREVKPSPISMRKYFPQQALSTIEVPKKDIETPNTILAKEINDPIIAESVTAVDAVVFDESPSIVSSPRGFAEPNLDLILSDESSSHGSLNVTPQAPTDLDVLNPIEYIDQTGINDSSRDAEITTAGSVHSDDESIHSLLSEDFMHGYEEAVVYEDESIPPTPTSSEVSSIQNSYAAVLTPKPRTYYKYFSDKYTHYSTSSALQEMKRLSNLLKDLMRQATYAIDESSHRYGETQQLISLRQSIVDINNIVDNSINSIQDAYTSGTSNVVDNQFWAIQKQLSQFIEEQTMHFKKLIPKMKQKSTKVNVLATMIARDVQQSTIISAVKVFLNDITFALSATEKVTGSKEFIVTQTLVRRKLRALTKLSASFETVKSKDKLSLSNEFLVQTTALISAWTNLSTAVELIATIDEPLNKTAYDLEFKAKFRVFSEKSDRIEGKLKKALKMIMDGTSSGVYEKKLIIEEVRMMELEWV